MATPSQIHVASIGQSFQSALTIALIAMTAAVAMVQNKKLPYQLSTFVKTVNGSMKLKNISSPTGTSQMVFLCVIRSPSDTSSVYQNAVNHESCFTVNSEAHWMVASGGADARFISL